MTTAQSLPAGLTFELPVDTESESELLVSIDLSREMLADLQRVAARQGLEPRTLLRLWALEGINRAYQDGLLDQAPQSWRSTARATEPRPLRPDLPRTLRSA